MTQSTTLACGHAATTDAPMQYCDRCDLDQPLVVKTLPVTGVAAFGPQNAQTGYEVSGKLDGMYRGDVTSHRSNKGIVWKAAPWDGREARLFRTRRAAAAYLMA